MNENYGWENRNYYQSGKDGIADLANDVAKHFNADYLRQQFNLIPRKLPVETPQIEYWKTLIRVRDAWDKIPENTKPIWNQLTETARLYPYVDPLHLSESAALRYEYHKSPFLKDVYLHAEQQELSIELQNKRSVVVSAPTSFGKSLLIEEVVASKLYRQIVIIQPTLALLDETRKNF